MRVASVKEGKIKRFLLSCFVKLKLCISKGIFSCDSTEVSLQCCFSWDLLYCSEANVMFGAGLDR